MLFIKIINNFAVANEKQHKNMSINLSLKKGLDLKIAGGIADSVLHQVKVSNCAIIPDDFHGFQPKPEVHEGDIVKAGTPLLRDKTFENVKIVSPVAGMVKAIVRGERRKIERVIVEASGAGDTVVFDSAVARTREEAVDLLSRSGLLVMIRQRPYDIVPRPDVVPRDIFVTAIDSAPLAADMALQVKGKEKYLARGVELLGNITTGKVYVAIRPDALTEIPGAEMINVTGPHPAGNAGVQIANISPVNKGEVVWTLDIVTLARIGELVETGRLDMTAYVAVTGSEVEKPYMAETVIGAPVEALLKGNEKQDGRHHRIISGNVLTGVSERHDGFVHYPYRQLTVIPEGDDVDEFMGWASISPNKMSVSRTFPGRFFGRTFNPDARLLGGRRAMIMSGEYDRVLPMDILPEFLLKAIIGRDIDKMEKLGIYEVSPEDFALCEYVDTSKMELQRIVREGLDFLHKELE